MKQIRTEIRSVSPTAKTRGNTTNYFSISSKYIMDDTPSNNYSSMVMDKPTTAATNYQS
jgi:hypothetical protein